MISFERNYNQMSVADIVAHRQTVLEAINHEVDKMNLQFQKNPMKLDTDTINSLFANLKAINETIAARKEKLTHERSCCGLGAVKTITWIAIGLEFLTCALLSAGEITNLVLENKVGDHVQDLERTCNASMPAGELKAMQALTVTKLVLVVMATGILIPLVSTIREIDKDQDRMELLMRMSEIKDQGDEIKAFLDSFREFKNTLDSKTEGKEKEQQKFTNCVQQLDRLGEFRERIPSRDHWISLMVQLLPEDHPIKTQLREMRDAALDALHTQDSPAQEKKSKKPKRRHHAKASSSDSKGYLSDDSRTPPLPNSKFRGEKLPVISFDHPVIPSRDRLQLSEPTQVPNKRFRREFIEHWERLEQTIGIRMDRIQLDGIGIDRRVTLASSIIQLGANLPVLLERVGSSNDHSEELLEVVVDKL
jgi:hypothetical protein